jgi:hypothetical protein
MPPAHYAHTAFFHNASLNPGAALAKYYEACGVKVLKNE